MELEQWLEQHGDAVQQVITSKSACDLFNTDDPSYPGFYARWPQLKAMIIEKTGPLSENIEDWLYDNLADWEHNGNFHTFEDGDPSGFGIRSDEWRDF